MRKFAQFFHNSTGANSPVHLIEACGSDSIYMLDGRWGDARCHEVAREVCAKRGYLAYQINAGAYILTAKPISKLVTLQVPIEEKTP